MSHVMNINVTDQDSRETALVLLDLNHPIEFNMFCALVASSLKHPSKRLFQPDGTEIRTTEELISAVAIVRDSCKQQDAHLDGDIHVDYEIVSTDRTDFACKWGDHQNYRFGDMLINPMKRLFQWNKRLIKEPPQPPSLPLSGNLHNIGRDAWSAFLTIEASYGPLVKLRLFNDVVYVCADPKTFDAISQVPDKRLPKCTFGMKTMASQGVFIADGQQWEFGRASLQQKLTPEALDDLVPVFVEKTQELQGEALALDLEAKEVDVMDWIERLTYDVICKVGFAYDPRMLARHNGEKEPFVEVFDDLLEISISAALYGALDFTGSMKQQFEAKTRFLNQSLDEMIESARSKPGTSLLHHLLVAKCPLTGRGFDDSELRDQLITLLVAGHKTTTLLLTWSLWHIATNGDVELQLSHELEQVFGDDMTRPPTGADLRKLQFLDKVIKETLRLASPVQVA